MNECRQPSLTETSTAECVRESIQFIREHEPAEGYFVGFSGGKDSIVTLQLVRMAGVKYQAFHSLTSIDPPEVVRFIRKEYPEVQIVKPKVSIYKLIPKRCPPSRIARWCCDELKKKPSWSIPLKYRLMGIRAEESRQRADRPRIDNYKKKLFMMKPIFLWKEWNVWEFIDQHGFAYPSLYDEGMGRIGCVVCPFQFGTGKAAQARQKASMERWPGIWRAYKDACRVWWDTREQHLYWHKSFDDWWDDWRGGYELTRAMNKK